MAALDEPPSLSEIARVLSDFRNEMRGQLAAFQRADVYAADRREVELRIKNVEDRAARVETDMERAETEKANMRRTLTIVVVGAVVAFGFNLVLLLTKALT
jgi:hypothetical protein